MASVMEIQSQKDALQEFCLKWTHYEMNLKNSIENLLQTESFVDCTLACDGFSLKAHKVVLSACSPYLQSLLIENPCEHPIIILRDVNFMQLKLLVEFMYRGEICAANDEIPALLKIAELLKIRGLANVNDKKSFTSSMINVVDKRINISAETDIDYEPDIKVRRLSQNYVEKNIVPHSENISRNGVKTTTRSEIMLLPTPSQVKDQEKITVKSLNSRTPNILKKNFNVLKVNHVGNPEIISLNGNTHLIDEGKFSVKFKAPTWSQTQLQDAIQAVVTQKMKFSQAATSFSIPKGTLYDNILGKSRRMLVLDEAGLSGEEEHSVLEFCCDETAWSYKRRTTLSLARIIEYVEKLRRLRDPGFTFTGLSGFRWWWAFCKKHSIISLYTDRDSDAVNGKEDSKREGT